ncbi:M6 family metalloprotease domain-containing protein [Paenibacillus sp. SI8]|uniref:M6 family metalloprotease domain-containing protein n=1 Tax=unclassified Paenibacillus TaxID=185978 RepID=UPI003465761C
MKVNYRILLVFAVVFLAALWVTGVVSAAPANPEEQTFVQPSGENFKARLQGDENLHWVETKDNEIVVKDSKGYWNYASMNGGKFKSSGKKYKIDSKPGSAVHKEDLHKWIKEHPKPRQASVFEESADAQTPSGLSDQIAQAAAAPSSGRFFNTDNQSTTGNQKILVLLIEFSDTSLIYSEDSWNKLFFDTTPNNKSVRNYYDEVSKGQLHFIPVSETAGTANDGIVKVHLNHSYTSGEAPVKEALLAADPYINVASLDTNGDGYIQNDELRVVTILAGYEGSYGGGTPSVWGHMTGMGDIDSPVLDGKKMCAFSYGGHYTQQGERHGDHQATLGIFAHELGHTLGLPDLYDTDYSSNGIGNHSLMSFGSWGSQSGETIGSTPVHLDAWCKVILGFVTPTVAQSSTSVAYTLNSSGTGNYNVIKIPTDDPLQYFLLENREQEGYDRGDYTHGGVAIWHIDQIGSSNSDENRRIVDLEEASSTNPSYNGYYFLGNNTSFTPNTNPNSNRFANSSVYVDYSEISTGINVDVPQTNSSSMTVNIFIANPVDTGIVSGAIYKLTALNSGKNLDVAGGSTADGANVQQWSNNGNLQQQWKVVDVGNGYYKLISQSSGKVLDVAGGSTADGANVQQWTDNGNAQQKWKIVDVGSGYYKLISQFSGKVLDVAEGSTADGANVQQWTDNGNAQQKWKFTLVSSAAQAASIEPTSVQ